MYLNEKSCFIKPSKLLHDTCLLCNAFQWQSFVWYLVKPLWGFSQHKTVHWNFNTFIFVIFLANVVDFFLIYIQMLRGCLVTGITINNRHNAKNAEFNVVTKRSFVMKVWLYIILGRSPDVCFRFIRHNTSLSKGKVVRSSLIFVKDTGTKAYLRERILGGGSLL